MKDIYSPLEIDEQWDQRAPMVEGDAFDAMVQMAPDDSSGGGVATMEPTASSAVEQPVSATAPAEPTQSTDGMVSTPDNTTTNIAEQPSDTQPVAEEASTEATTPAVTEVPTTDDQSVASLEGQQVPTAEDPTQPPHIIPEPQPPLPEVPTDTVGSTEAPEAPAGDAAPEDVQPNDAMPHTVPPIEEYHPDPGNERPTPTEPNNTEPEESGNDSTPAPAEDVEKLDQAVAELPTSPTKLFVEKKDVEDEKDGGDEEDNKLKVEVEEDEVDGDIEHGKEKKPDAHRKQAVEALENNIADLRREVKEKEKLKKDHEDRRQEEERKISDLQAEIDFKKSEIAAFENAKAALTE